MHSRNMIFSNFKIGNILLILVYVVRVNFAIECSLNVTENITDGQKNGDQIIKNGVVYSPENYFHRQNEIFGCTCNVKKCVRKCCRPTKIVTLSGCQKDNVSEEFVVNVFRETEPKGIGDFHFATGLKCKKKHSMFPYRNPTEKFYVQEDGWLYVPKHDRYKENDLFCMDIFRNSSTSKTEFFAFVCNDKEPLYRYKTYGMIISIPFLLATFLVYVFLPDRNLPAKALISYVLSLLLAYIFLVTIQLDGPQEYGSCVATAFLCYFFFMASFFWMNASCLDIFFTFSGIRGLLGDKREQRHFIYYSAYAWGSSLFLVGLAAVFTFWITDHNTHFYTGIGVVKCWFKDGWPTGIYFYFPIAIMLIINTVLFGVTTYKIKKVQRDTKMLDNVDSRKHKCDSNDKQRFVLYVKLLFAMGMNWSFEVVSWALMWRWFGVPDYIWILSDFCNAIYGVFIFFIFVFKRNIWKSLKKRYLHLTGRPPTQTLATTNRTTVGKFSGSSEQ